MGRHAAAAAAGGGPGGPGRAAPGRWVLDVGCGTGAPACTLAAERGARVTGITTTPAGIAAARSRAVAEGVEESVTFDGRDGQDNLFPDAAFDRVWVLESSHLMRRHDRLMSECARVLKPGGRLVLCDIMLRRPNGSPRGAAAAETAGAPA